MPNKLLFIEANTTGTGMLALTKAASWGFVPIFFTNKPERYLGLAETGCHVCVCNTNDLDELSMIIERHMQREEICGIATTSDFYLETVAVLTTRYGLPGNPPEAIRSARDKAMTRETLARAGVHQPLFAAVRSVLDVEEAIAAVGLPCVLKPADDSGSNDVLLCHTVAQAQQHAAKILAVTANIRGQQTAGTVLVEQYLEAPEFSVEMFTWQGETTCIGITQKSLHGIPYFVESRHLFPAPLPPAQWTAIEETVRAALQALGIHSGATHTEVKWTAEGAAVIEVNARLAGGMIPELIRLATGIDMLEQQVLGTVGRASVPAVTYQGTAGIQFLMAEQAGVLLSIEGTEAAGQVPGVQKVTITGQPGAAVQPPQNAYHRLGHIMVHSETAEETAERLQQAVNCIHIQVESEKRGGVLS